MRERKVERHNIYDNQNKRAHSVSPLTNPRIYSAVERKHLLISKSDSLWIRIQYIKHWTLSDKDYPHHKISKYYDTPPCRSKAYEMEPASQYLKKYSRKRIRDRYKRPIGPTYVHRHTQCPLSEYLNTLRRDTSVDVKTSNWHGSELVRKENKYHYSVLLTPFVS